MFKDEIYQKKFKFPCNKCNGQVIVEYDIDYDWGDRHMYFNKMYCSECGREFFGYSFNKTEEGLVYDFVWDKWRDDNNG